ncbi:MAG: hypothetical protein ASARMPRED_006645 [Alectoria sarmentosa]|nr:MAG: hypothetical protein ASARMPRED_006645 [Alectoria sarmentosa]
MSGLMHKVKDALQGGHKNGTSPVPKSSPPATNFITPEDEKLAHDGLQGEHGSQSGVHDTPVSGSVAHGDSMSPTNPGVLNSTKRGIHGDRDTGTSGTGLSNQELTGQTATDGESGSVAHGSSMSPTNPGVLHSTKPGIHGARDAGTGSTGLSNSELMQDSGAGSGIGSGTGSGYDSTSRDTGIGSGNNAGPQYTGTSERDTGLVGSGIDTTGRGTTMDESSMNAGSGSGYNPNDRTSTGLAGEDVLTGSGSGYDSNSRMDRDNTTTGSGLGRDDGMIAGGSVPQTGSGYDSNTRGADMTGGGTGSGLTGDDSGFNSGYDSNTRDTGLTGGRMDGTESGLSGGGSGMGSGYDSNTRDTGLTGGGISSTGSGITGGDSSYGSGVGSSGGTGLGGEGEQYVDGSEKHHRGDGHPEDIVHPGHHYTETAKALDPHLN